jgi:hypothetical protein
MTLHDPPYNDGFTHEALHTTFVLMETFANHVLDSRCAAKFSDVYAKAEAVQSAMAELYQLIGIKMDDAMMAEVDAGVDRTKDC